MRERSYGLVLRCLDFSETSKVVYFFTPEKGLLKTLAKGAKRPKNPFHSALDLLAFGELLYIPKERGLSLITEFYLHENFSHIRQNFLPLSLSFYILEVLRLSLTENLASYFLFQRTLETLAELNGTPISTLTLPRNLLFFLLSTVEFLGIFPNIERCHNCGVEFPLRSPVAWSRTGGVICSSCQWKTATNWQLPASALRILVALKNQTLEEMRRTNLVPQQSINLVGFLHHVLVHFLQRPIRCWAYVWESLQPLLDETLQKPKKIVGEK